ncbi:hypothetical protein BpHYR1_010694 [Brachionus plicatilis]|uniref:Uncharacterized protein n=1 Tax=Brachionus plicatilis TaxID=10195 RepID=A0A3M7SVJ1_BRAPC|nr:hypothetical protein BpHYR1_010694 [Brachionus plicatilis]
MLKIDQYFKMVSNNQTFTVDAALNVAPFCIHRITFKLLETDSIEVDLKPKQGYISGKKYLKLGKGTNSDKQFFKCKN